MLIATTTTTHLVSILLEPGLGPRHSHSACRLKYAASLVEDVLDGCGYGGIVHQQHTINQLAAQPERLGANL